MSKQIETPERMPQAAKMTSLKINPKVRYLADLAATVTGQSLTGYIEEALMASLSRVTLRLPPEPELIYGPGGEPLPPNPTDVEAEQVQSAAMTIANEANALWSESEFGRIENLFILAPRLVPDEDKALLNYIHSRKDLRVDTGQVSNRLFTGETYRLNREKIDSEWESVKTAFAKSKGRK